MDNDGTDVRGFMLASGGKTLASSVHEDKKPQSSNYKPNNDIVFTIYIALDTSI